MVNCRECRAPNAGFKCSGCHQVDYCSSACQKKDWPSHKRSCNRKGSSTSGPKDTRQPIDSNVPYSYQKWKTVPKFADEYFAEYPEDVSDHDILICEQTRLRDEVESRKISFLDDPQHLVKNPMKRFEKAPNARKVRHPQIGDVFYYKPTPYLYQPKTDAFENRQQLFRNVVGYRKIYEIGETYVSLGFVDLWQLVDGEFDNVRSGGTLNFYGYDQGEVTVARSLLVLDMAKAPAEEVSLKTLLQVWFSSCLDQQTKEELTAFIHKRRSETKGSLVTKFAEAWLNGMELTASEAKNKFSLGLSSDFFRPILALNKNIDRVKYCRYLMTGCLFLEKEDDAVCGNPTIFPSSQDSVMSWERNFESFFSSLDTHGVDFMHCHSLINDSLLHVKSKIVKFRNKVQSGVIKCHLQVKKVEVGDEDFATEIKDLQPKGINWSNLPDYMDRVDFITYARKCSGRDTLHCFHSLRWTDYVFGSKSVDLVIMPKVLGEIATMLEDSVKMTLQRNRVTKYPEDSSLKLPMLKPQRQALEYFMAHTMGHECGEKFLKFFLKGLNHSHMPLLEHYNPFNVHPQLNNAAFSFNKSVNIDWILPGCGASWESRPKFFE